VKNALIIVPLVKMVLNVLAVKVIFSYKEPTVKNPVTLGITLMDKEYAKNAVIIATIVLLLRTVLLVRQDITIKKVHVKNLVI